MKKNYRRVIYHNWRHAFNVAQAMFAVLTVIFFRDLISRSLQVKKFNYIDSALMLGVRSTLFLDRA